MLNIFNTLKKNITKLFNFTVDIAIILKYILFNYKINLFKGQVLKFLNKRMFIEEQKFKMSFCFFLLNFFFFFCN